MILLLYQPDIPQNTGSLMRLAACMGVDLHIIEPCGFALDDKRIRRVGMDYMNHVVLTRHRSWDAFCDSRNNKKSGRVLLLSARAATPYTHVSYEPDDILLLGRESAGVPDNVRLAADACITIPMQAGVRSLNVAMAASMVLGEALRQIRGIGVAG